MSGHLKAVLGIFLVFLFGCVSGWISSSVVHLHMTNQLLQGGAEGVGALLERRLTGDLSLDPDQKTKIHELVLDNVAQRKIIQKQIQPQVQELNRETFYSICSILRPDQQEKFRKNVTALLRHRQGRDAPAPNALGNNPAPAETSATPATTNAP